LRAPGLGHRILTFNTPNTPDFPTTTTPLPLPAVHEEVYRLRRYLLGVPEGQAEILREQALPQESNIDVMGGIDFRKGCYVGQELTIRTEHRGVVRKRVLPCLLYPSESEGVPEAALGGGLEGLYRPGIGEVGGGVSAEMVPAEASIGRVGKKGRSAGKWLRGVGNVGLALCRLEIMTDVVLTGETGGGGFDAGDEFAVGLAGGGEDGEGQKVKIKAFVPDWLRERLAGKEGH
jgi:folate-binding protein YgfZ